MRWSHHGAQEALAQTFYRGMMPKKSIGSVYMFELRRPGETVRAVHVQLPQVKITSPPCRGIVFGGSRR